jgi:cytoskeletal protein RodZ
MTDDVMTAGQTVAAARVAAGLTVAQVADATRIRATLVTAIENDDFRLCGGDVYARGHLKSIATAIGVDPAAVVAAFDRQRGTEHPVSAPVEPVASSTRATTASGGSLGALAGPLGVSVESGRRNGGANWTAVMALALVAVLGVATVTALANRGSSTPVASPSSSPSVTPSTSESPTDTPTEQPTAQPTESPTDTVAQAEGVNVVMTITGKASWVRVTGGTAGKTLYEGTLTEGDSKTFKDDTLVKLLLGNAGAVSLVVNGRDVGAPGGSGKVVTTEFGPGDPNGQAG